MVIRLKDALGWVSRWRFSSSEAKGAAYRTEWRHESMIDGGRNKRFSLVGGVGCNWKRKWQEPRLERQGGA